MEVLHRPRPHRIRQVGEHLRVAERHCCRSRGRHQQAEIIGVGIDGQLHVDGLGGPVAGDQRDLAADGGLGAGRRDHAAAPAGHGRRRDEVASTPASRATTVPAARERDCAGAGLGTRHEAKDAADDGSVPPGTSRSGHETLRATGPGGSAVRRRLTSRRADPPARGRARGTARIAVTAASRVTPASPSTGVGTTTSGQVGRAETPTDARRPATEQPGRERCDPDAARSAPSPASSYDAVLDASPSGSSSAADVPSAEKSTANPSKPGLAQQSGPARRYPARSRRGVPRADTTQRSTSRTRTASTARTVPNPLAVGSVPASTPAERSARRPGQRSPRRHPRYAATVRQRERAAPRISGGGDVLHGRRIGEHPVPGWQFQALLTSDHGPEHLDLDPVRPGELLFGGVGNSRCRSSTARRVVDPGTTGRSANQTGRPRRAVHQQRDRATDRIRTDAAGRQVRQVRQFGQFAGDRP